jgi:hypothetical protein
MSAFHSMGGGFKYPGDDQQSVQDRARLMRREAQRHQEKADRAAQRAEQLEQLAPLSVLDPFQDKAVILFEVHPGNKPLTYAAVRIAGQWWLTGTTQVPMRWPILVAWWAENNLQWVRQMVTGMIMWPIVTPFPKSDDQYHFPTTQ